MAIKVPERLRKVHVVDGELALADIALMSVVILQSIEVPWLEIRWLRYDLFLNLRESVDYSIHKRVLRLLSDASKAAVENHGFALFGWSVMLPSVLYGLVFFIYKFLILRLVNFLEIFSFTLILFKPSVILRNLLFFRKALMVLAFQRYIGSIVHKIVILVSKF